MENKVLKLKFRVIALVSGDGSPASKSKALFQKFKDNNIKKYLNKNSLNQAGYEVEIENQAMFDGLDTAELDDYFYAFDKTEWKREDLFKEQYNKKYWDKVLKPDGSYELEPDGKHYKMVLTDNPPKPIDIVTEGEVDYKTITAYKTKLKSKSKTYNGGILILSDYESPNQTVAFSRTSPLDHYALFVYSNGIEKKENYAHEIGHMLGLPHSFYTDKEKEAYKTAKENILGNGMPEFNLNGTRNSKCILPINEKIQRATSSSTIYNGKQFYAKKSTLIAKLNSSNAYFNTKKVSATNDKTNIETTHRGQPSSVVVAGSGSGRNTQTKAQYIEACNKIISQNALYVQENNSAIIKLNNVRDNDKVSVHEYEMNFKASDYVVILRETKIYSYEVIEQLHNNYLMFKSGSTKNFMDYNNTKILYLYNQIKVMRDDLKHY